MSHKLTLVDLNAKRQSRFAKIESSLLLNTTSGVYYVRKSFKRYKIPELFETTKEVKIGRARAKAAAMIADHQSKYLGSGQTLLQKRVGRLVHEQIDEILKTVTPKKRVGTQDNHKFYLGELRAEWGSWPLERITAVAWATWLQEFQARKSRKTFADYAKHMNLIMRNAYQGKHISHLIRLENPDRPKKTGRVFTREEIKALWKAMNDENRDQFVLCYECFMRLREALHLTWEHVDISTGVVTLEADDVKTGSKTGKGRAFIVSKTALSRLRARFKHTKGAYVFPSPENPRAPLNQNKTAWRSAKKRAGIVGKARWHDLRHTALSRALLEEKADPVAVSEYAGVSLRTIQKVYLHSTHELTAAVSHSVKI